MILYWVLNVPYRPIQPPFLSGRLGVMGCSSVACWEFPLYHRHQDWIIWSKITHLGPQRLFFNVWFVSRVPLYCQMHPFLSGRLGVMGRSSLAGWEYHTWYIYQERIICLEITHQVPLTWFLMFNVPYRPIHPPFLSGQLGVIGVPHWPFGSLPYKTDIGIELYGQILHI